MMKAEETRLTEVWHMQHASHTSGILWSQLTYIIYVSWDHNTWQTTYSNISTDHGYSMRGIRTALMNLTLGLRSLFDVSRKLKCEWMWRTSRCIRTKWLYSSKNSKRNYTNEIINVNCIDTFTPWHSVIRRSHLTSSSRRIAWTY